MSKKIKPTHQAQATKVIGSTTTYLGHEYGMRPGHQVRIVAVLPNAASPDCDPDAESSSPISDDAELARRGGVKTTDRIETQAWIEKEGRFSWVTNDPAATELKMFAERRK